MEKFEQLYDKDGKVTNPEVARYMAEGEDKMRVGENTVGKKYTREDIDSHTDAVGEIVQERKNVEALVEKIKMSLSPDELKFIKKLHAEGQYQWTEKLIKSIEG